MTVALAIGAGILMTAIAVAIGGLALDVTAAALAPALLETYLRVKERGLL